MMQPGEGRPIPGHPHALAVALAGDDAARRCDRAMAAAITVSVVVREVMESALEETAQALVVIAEHEADVEAISHGQAMPAAPHEKRSSGSCVTRPAD